MNIYLRHLLALVFLTHLSYITNAQAVIDPSVINPDYDSIKQSMIQRRTAIIPQQQNVVFNGSQLRIAEDSNCFIPRDASYIPVARNDDGSFGPLALQFTYSLYGTNYNQVYINTNGNLTFTNSLGEYNSEGFPISTPMVAAFWADVDTRSGGQIYYKLTSTNLIVTWDGVGYFSGQTDKLNTFQIVITNGFDPLLGNGNNTAFYYQDMQWTTGSASGGVSGFGGTPATVGINKGNVVNYIQIGRFNVNSPVYDGPGGSFDGINYLDNKCFPFNVGDSSANIPPNVSGLPVTNPVTVNVGDTVNLSPQFIGPEVGETVTTQVNTGGACKTTFTVNNGTLSQVNLRFIADTCNVGTNVMTFTATDNGVPTRFTTVTYTIIVNKLNQTITFPAPSQIPTSGTVTLSATASSGLPVTYTLLSGPGSVSGNILYINGVGLITVRASQPGNLVYNAATPRDVAFCIVPSQPGVITGSTEVCINSTSSYSVPDIQGANFIWSVDAGGTVTSSGNTASVQWTSLGTHSLSVSYTTNCGTQGAARSLNVLVANKTVSGTFTNMLPANGSINILFPITFSWFPVTNAVFYDIYIWPDTSTKPASPTIANITGINYILYSSSLLEYGKAYKWQVVARSICNELESPVLTFRMRYLPDVIVNNIQVPASGFSGQPISINWEVKNIGTGATLNQQWIDRVYLSKDALLDDQDINLGTAGNVSELAPGNSYVRTASFTLPQGISDNYYAIVVTDAYTQLRESEEANNTSVSTLRSAIQLTPPPDLQVTSIVPPNFAFSGQDVSVTWSITNLGTGQTVAGSWTDFVYLSSQAQFNAATAVNIGAFNHTGALAVNGSYSRSGTFRLPEGIFGPYYIYVVTDVYNQVYEHAQEGNNTRRSDSIQVILTPPIDLVVTQIILPQNASNRQSIPISWRVENQGGSSTENRNWTDNIYLSGTTPFNADSARFLGSASRPNALAPGDGYDMQRNFTIPAGITGPYYIYVKTDAGNNIFEYTYENNNTTRSSQTLNVLSPDLIVSGVTAPSADTSGHTINITWTVKNSGAGRLYNSSITDRIMLSASPIYNAANALELKRLSYNTGDLTSDSTFIRQTAVLFPNGISGNYYLHVFTDYANNIYETSDDNNIGNSNPVLVTLGPWPDLQVLGIQVRDSATAGDIIPLTYTVVNRGDKTVNDPTWTDKIYLSKKATWDSANSVFIREASQNRIITKDSFYTVNTTIRIPVDFVDTAYYVYVFTDANKNVYEHTAEGNNISRSAPVQVKKYPPVDLAVTSITAPDSGRTGVPIIVQWTVLNKGEAATLQSQWGDALYMSADTIWDGSDRLIKEFTHSGSLVQGASYNNTQSFVLPNGVAGTYYLLMVTDRANVTSDADRSNNYKLIRQSNGGGGNGDPIPIVIVLTNPPDLVVTGLTIPDEGNAGQPIKVNWTVKNSGIGIMAVNAWTEKIYLSTNLQLDAGDRLIGSYARTGSLNSGGEYSDSLQAFLPIEFEGNYILIFKTDANDNVYEHGAEENTAIAPIAVVKAPLSDLVVTNIQAPAMAMAGDTVTINWTLKNQGVNPSNGYMQEAVYLSEDTVKDISDIMLGSVQRSINLAPGGEINQSYTVELNGVSLRNYRVLVYTDNLNNISETIDSNNVSVSFQTMMVTVPALPLNVLTSKDLRKNKEIYYRIDIPDSLAGESLLIALRGDSANGSNEIYLRYGEMPTRAVYDYSHSQPYQGNQEIVVPVLQSGTYYLMVYGSTPSGTIQPVTLRASILRFEVRNVNADKGGNTGQVTVQINGSKLGNVTGVRLTSGMGVVHADSVFIKDPTKLYAVFNLAGAALGAYDVVAENAAGDTAVLEDGFSVMAGNAGGLVTNVITPPNTRPSNTISMTVEFTNTGNTDIINPVLKITSLGGAPIAFNPAELVNDTKELTLTLQELNGPVGRLRPGVSGTIIVYAKATTVLGFLLVQSND